MYGTKNFDNSANSKNKMPFIYAHTRKACYQYSWDWAPFMNTIGVWKDIYFAGYNDVMIDYVWARNREVSEESAIVNFAVQLKLASNADMKNMQIEITELNNANEPIRVPLKNG